MMKDADFRFIKWAIKQIDQIDLLDSFSPEFLAFTGNNDKLVSNWKCQNHITIGGGTHFMVFDHAEEISSGINERLAEINV